MSEHRMKLKVTPIGDWRIHEPWDCPACEEKEAAKMEREEARAKVEEVYGPEFLGRFERVAANLKGATTEAERRLAVNAAAALYFEAEAKADGMDAVMFLLPTPAGSSN